MVNSRIWELKIIKSVSSFDLTFSHSSIGGRGDGGTFLVKKASGDVWRGLQNKSKSRGERKGSPKIF